jgi:hypothetical protein
MSVVLGIGSAEELMFGVSGFGLTEQPSMRIDETQALNMIKEVLTLHLLYRAMILVLLKKEGRVLQRKGTAVKQQGLRWFKSNPRNQQNLNRLLLSSGFPISPQCSASRELRETFVIFFHPVDALRCPIANKCRKVSCRTQRLLRSGEGESFVDREFRGRSWYFYETPVHKNPP